MVLSSDDITVTRHHNSTFCEETHIMLIRGNFSKIKYVQTRLNDAEDVQQTFTMLFPISRMSWDDVNSCIYDRNHNFQGCWFEGC